MAIFSRALMGLALTLVLSQSASAQDFDILDLPKAELPELSFDLFGSNTQLAESIDFAVLEPCKVCDCEQTGVCLCDDCTCPNCPNKKAKPDHRPVITAKVKDDCPPCAKLKADVKSDERLSDFRWRFVETNGDAPIVEWQGNGRKVYFEGWFGPEFFLSSYERSQQPRQETAQARQTYRSVYRPLPSYAPMPSFGPCRTCR